MGPEKESIRLSALRHSTNIMVNATRAFDMNIESDRHSINIPKKQQQVRFKTLID